MNILQGKRMFANTQKMVSVMKFLCIVLILGVGEIVYGQSFPPNGVKAESDFNIADQFSFGKLEITVSGISGSTNIRVLLPKGVTYKTGSITNVTGGTAVEGSMADLNKPEFTLTGSSVTFTIEKKASKEAFDAARGVGGGSTSKIKDRVEVISSGRQGESNEYTFKYPEVSVQNVAAHSDAFGDSGVKTFDIRNGGNGTLYDIYFYVEYPAGITHKQISFNGNVLTPTNVTGSRYSYKIERSSLPSGGLANNQSITLQHEYKVNSCGTVNIVYNAGWGESATNLYQTNQANRSVTSPTGAPKIGLNPNNTKTYFVPDTDGLCGTYIGEYVLTYKNAGTTTNLASAMRNVVMRLHESYVDNAVVYIPDDVRIVNGANHNEVVANLTATTTHPRKKIYLVDFSTINMVSGKESLSGLSDLDGDGKYNDLESGKEITIRFKLKRETPVVCLSDKPFSGSYSVQRVIQFGYTDICGNIKTPDTQPDVKPTILTRSFHGVTDSSVVPLAMAENATVNGGFSFGGSTFIASDVMQGKASAQSEIKKYLQYEIELPAGLTVSNVRMFNKQSGTTVKHTLNQTGNKVIISGAKGATVTIEHISLDFTNNCTTGGAGTRPIKYSLNYVEEYNGKTCVTKLMCAEKNIRFICPQKCTEEGPVILKTSGRRADNSLGWTDHTMTTRATATSVDPIDLKRSLYLDDIEITAEGRQNKGNTDNLYYTFLTGDNISLKPLNIEVSFFRAGAQVGTTQTLTSAVATVSPEGTKQRIIWNLTSALPSGQLLADDTFTVKASYTVDKVLNDRSNAKDALLGDASHFYMLKPADTKWYYCGVPIIPDFYVAGTFTINGSNEFNLIGCNPINIGSNMGYLARRFNSAGVTYKNEFRPDRLIKTFTITLPKTYSITKLEYEYTINSATGARGPIIEISLDDLQKTTVGNNIEYTYVNKPKGTKGYLPPGALTAENSYSAFIRPTVQASCGSIEGQGTTGTERGILAVTYDDFYYVNHLGRSVPGTDSEDQNKSLVLRQKPTMTLRAVGNTSLKVTKVEEEIEVKLTNTHSSSTASYTWISIPDVTGIQVISLTDVSSGSVITPQSGVGNEKMYHLSTAGLTAGQSANYKIKLKLINCNKVDLVIHGGWNCGAFPNGGLAGEGTCSASNIKYVLDPVKSEIQVTAAAGSPVSGAGLKMCEDNKYSYILNSAGEGVIVNPKFQIAIPTGIIINTVRAEYPINSGTWHTFANPPAGATSFEADLTQHPSFPVAGLPGTLGTTSLNARQIRMEFNVQPDCNYVAGSSFDVQVTGKNMCGDAITGNRVSTITAGIDGVTGGTYSVDNTLRYKNGDANACATGAVYKGKHTIIATAGIMTGNDGEVVVEIPKGFDYITGSFAVVGKSVGATFANPTYKNLITKPSGVKEVHIGIPSGMKNDDFFEYEITVKQTANTEATDCQSTQNLTYWTIDVASGVPCKGTTCPQIITKTTPQNGTEAIVVNRAKLTLENIKVTSTIVSGREQVTFTYDVKNSSSTVAYNGNLAVNLYNDVNNDGRTDASELVTTFNLASISVVANGTLTGQTSTITLNEDQVCRMYLIITNDKNPCLCDSIAFRTNAPDPIAGLVTDMTVCENESKPFNTTAIPNYTNYSWNSANVAALAYLQGGTNIKTPTFRYTGAPLTANAVFTYTVKITRTNGCTATQEVKVTVTPAPAGPAVTPQSFCGASTKVLDLKSRVNSANPSIVKVYDTTGVLLADTDILITGSYQVSIQSIGQCESKKSTVSVTVNPISNLSPITTTFCSGVHTISDIKTAVQTANSSVTNIKVYVDGTEETNGSAKIVSGKTYKVTAELSGCTTNELTISITPNTSKPGITQAGLCSGATIADLKSFIGTSITGVTVRVYSSVTATAEESDATSLADGSSYYYSVQETGKCESERSVINVALVKSPVVTSPYTFCTGAKIANLGDAIDPVNAHSLRIYEVATGGVALDRNTVNLKAQTYYVSRVSTTTPVCESSRVAVVVNLTADNTVSSVSGTSTICLGETFSLTHTTTGATGIGVATGIPSGVTATWSSNVITISGTPTTAGTYSYTIPLTGGCGTVSATGTITVNAKPNAPVVVVSTTVCPTTATSTVSFTSYATALSGHTLKWYDDATTTTVTTALTVDKNVTTRTEVTKYVSQVNASGCESARVPVKIIVDDTQIPTVSAPTELVISCTDTAFDSKVSTWLGQATATDACVGARPVTNDYVKPATLCTRGDITVTFEATDTFGNKGTSTSKIKLIFIDAKNDNPTQTTPIDALIGGTAGNVLDNDELNGNPATISNVDISIVQVAIPQAGTTNTNVPTLNPATGDVTVPSNTPGGTYTIEYKICDKANSTICDTATVTVIVKGTIKANDDDFTTTPIGGKNGGTVGTSVFGNDTLTGKVVGSTTVSVTITNDGGLTGVTIDNDGKITVPANTPAGNYTLTYEICEKDAAGVKTNNCSQAKVTIKVLETPLVANPDTFNIPNGVSGGATPSVLTNDSLDGVQNPNPTTEVLLTPGAPSNPNLAMNPDGTITVSPNTPAGTYTYPYTICERLNPSNCKTATATITVGNPVVVANDDNFSSSPVNGATGSTLLGNVLNNNGAGTDQYNGIDATISNVTISVVTPAQGIGGSTLVPVLDTATGVVSVPVGTPGGTYEITYQICDKINLTNCDTAKITVKVVSIDAVNDTPVAIPSSGGTVPSVLGNDTLNGGQATTGNVDLTWDASTVPSGFTTNADGMINVPSGATNGTYVIKYTICDKVNPTVCDTATVTVVVSNIDAVNDTPVAIPSSGGTVPSVLGNDTLNGGQATTGNVDLTWDASTVPSGFTTNTDGTITVATNTPSGSYPINYTICDKANSTVCDTATVTVVVSNIDAVNDTPVAIPSSGGTVPSVLGNDTLNGNPATTGNVDLTWNTTAPSGLTLNPDGTITVAPNTPSGSYPINYTICDKANSTVCDTATVTVVVSNIDAVNDTPVAIPSLGGTVPSVLGNDTLNGGQATSTNVDLTWNTTVPAGLTLNTDGTITVAPNTPSGSYPINYTICDKANSTVCDTAIVTVVVSNIDAINDTPVAIPSSGGTVPSVLGNDTLNGGQATTTNVDLTWDASTVPTGFTTNTDGTITVAPNTPSGSYPINYTICDKANSTVCDTATVTVVVAASTIEAVEDDYRSSVINGASGNSNVGNVLSNDKLNGTIPATTSNVVITQVTGAVPVVPGANVPVLDTTTGVVSVPSNTPSGDYTIVYKITDITGGLEDTATIYVKVLIPSTESELDITKETVSLVENPVVGQQITYTFTVTYRGNETLTDVKITDTRIGVTIPVPNLSPTTRGYTTAIAYVLTQSDIDSHKIENSATVSGMSPTKGLITDISDNNTPSVDENGDGDMGNDPTITLFRTIKSNSDHGVVALDGFSTGIVPNLNIFDNDLLNGQPVTSGDVVLTSGSSPYLVINSDGTVGINPETPGGTYKISYTICDKVLPGLCSETEVTIEVVNHCTLEFYNGLSVNSDGLNDQLQIKGLDCYPENTLRIFNRWGVEVYNTEGYNNVSRVFEGISNGRVTINKEAKLPQGTYYLILDYKLRTGEVKRKGTWIYISPESN